MEPVHPVATGCDFRTATIDNDLVDLLPPLLPTRQAARLACQQHETQHNLYRDLTINVCTTAWEFFKKYPRLDFPPAP
ncbi:MAG TPA: hypothetical protein VI299_27245 [Polyangiales bacterium]